MRTLLIVPAIYLLSTAVFCLATCTAGAAEIESAGYSERSFNKRKMEAYRAGDDFKYARAPKYDPLQTGFWNRVDRFIAGRFGTKDTRLTIRYVLMFIALVLVVLFIRKSVFTGVVMKESARPGGYTIVEENLHTIDFNKAINEAAEAKEYRLAIRLYFLKTLKMLDDRKLIRHSREKTNRDYLNELNNTALKEDFRWLARSFEIAWYGNVQPEQALFQQVQGMYTDFFKQVEQ